MFIVNFIRKTITDDVFSGIHQVSYMLKWSLPYIKRYRGYLSLLIFLVLVSVGLSLAQVNFVQRSIDAVMVKDWPLLVQVFLLFAGVSALQILHGYIYGHYSNLVNVNMIKDAKERYTQAVLYAQMLPIEKQSGGELITRHNDDIPVAIGFIKEVYANFLSNPVMALGAFIYLMTFNWQLSLAVFLPVPIIAICLNYVSSRASRIYREMMDSRDEYAEEVYDISHGMEIIKAYNMQDYKLNKAKRVIQDIFNKRYSITKIEMVAQVLIMFLGYMPDITALIYGGFLVINGELPVSILFAYYMLIEKVSIPTKFIFSSMHSVKNSYQSMKRLDNILDIEAERQDGRDFPYAGSKSIIRFDKVNFSYAEGKSVLKDVGLELLHGKCIGIAGDSGAGKSTMVNLICGFYQTGKGKISVFGEDISDWNLQALRANIAYVSQDTYILPGTLYENIRYGRLDSSSEEVSDAIRKAGLSDFVNSLPSGINTVLTESGRNLSGGQRQRISLARALLRNAGIYIFDEPASSLDPDTAGFVLNNIRELMRDKAVMIISHNPDTLKLCDEIYLVREGEITEKGTIDELMKKNYYELSLHDAGEH